jgi:hypothetical protein
MIEVNKPADTTPNVRCYKCKNEFYVHPLTSMSAPFMTDCKLHKTNCKHESDSKHIGLNDFGTPCEWKCKHCGEFYR